jgi:predicted amidohydrolase YtcJ
MTAGVDLSACADLGAVRAALKKAATAAGPGQWITGWGLDPNAFGAIPITSDAIEDVLGGRPALLTLFDAHSALASQQALARAGINGPARSNPAPPSSATPAATPPGTCSNGAPSAWSTRSSRPNRPRAAALGSPPCCTTWPPPA